MEPRIQYATTEDGVSIALCTAGEGTALVSMPNFPWTHIGLSWPGGPGRAPFDERLAEKRRLVLYDGRGSGLSDRDVTDFSLEAHIADLQAVVDHLGLATFALLATLHAGPTAIAYAARYPERVSRLVLWCSWARTSDMIHPRGEALVAIAQKDWRLFIETVARNTWRFANEEAVRSLASKMREMTTQEAYLAGIQAGIDHDATDLLPQVQCPALVLHRRELRWPDIGLARRLASGIPDAQLTILEGKSSSPFEGGVGALASAIDEFLGEGEDAAESKRPSGLATILFTDIESSTALTQRLGDAKAQELVRAHNTIVRGALKACGGSEIKHTGDGIMASFPSASGALECAVAIQREVEAHGVGAHGHAPLRVRIGLNAGEPVAEEQDLFGTAVQLASRICDRAAGGEILASDVVRQLAAGKGFLFSDRGETELRGFEDPVRLFEVRWREGA